jgi:hypothetical protein
MMAALWTASRRPAISALAAGPDSLCVDSSVGPDGRPVLAREEGGQLEAVKREPVVTGVLLAVDPPDTLTTKQNQIRT